MRDPDPVLVAQRVRAAKAYAKLTRDELAARVNISPSTLDHMEGKRSALRGATWTELDNIAQACGLPGAFFTADFDRLGEIALPDTPGLSTTATPSEKAKRSASAKARAAGPRLRGNRSTAPRKKRAQDDAGEAR